MENNFADCNLLPYSHRYHPRYNKLQRNLKSKKVKRTLAPFVPPSPAIPSLVPQKRPLP